jgi:hypothetical protein
VSAPLVRTDFTDDSAWARVVDECTRPSPEGFQAAVEPVDDPQLDGAAWASLREAAVRNPSGGAVLFVVDATTFASAEHPVLVVSTSIFLTENRPDEYSRPFRCIPGQLWGVENNLNLANLDWRDFADRVDADGVFRGF